jgi:hypothetical protein
VAILSVIVELANARLKMFPFDQHQLSNEQPMLWNEREKEMNAVSQRRTKRIQGDEFD